ncbi:MAG: type II secretion system F family protein, partial [Pirellulales bacterium]
KKSIKYWCQFKGQGHVRAGESLDQAMQLVGEAVSEPVASEYRRCAKQLEMGLSVSATMQALSYRINIMDIRIFATALSVHRESGGNLPETLERLAKVIRDRMAYIQHQQSVTASGRISAFIIAVIGPILAGYLFIVQPEYGQGLWNDELGQVLLIGAGVSELIGLFIVSRMLKSAY